MRVPSRREGLAALLGAAGLWAPAKTFAATHGFTLERGYEGVGHYDNVHKGKGKIGVRFFPFDGASLPARFLTYDIPPGASEGVHVHRLGDTVEGAYDEYYYVVSGSGRMEIDGKLVPIVAGDHVHTPLGVAHGVENTSQTEMLKIFLTFIVR